MSGGHQRIQNMVLIVHIEGVGEVLRLAGRGQCQTVRESHPWIHFNETDSSPVNVGPQGHCAGLNVLQGNRKTFKVTPDT